MSQELTQQPQQTLLDGWLNHQQQQQDIATDTTMNSMR
jgi:hypothetical protein